MKTKPLALLAAVSAVAASSAQAAIINIADYTLTPDGTNYGSSNHYLNTTSVQLTGSISAAIF